jgi:cation transport ATPase
MMSGADPDGAKTAQIGRVAGGYWELPIVGLSCAGEAAGLERRLRQIEGVRAVTVNPLTEMAYVSFAPEWCEVAMVVAEIERAGYRVR